MLRVIVKQLPGAHEVPKYRCEFSERPGEPFVSYVLAATDEGVLRTFLSDKLELSADAVSRLIVQLASSNVAAAEVADWALPEARALVRLVERETKLVQDKSKSTMPVAQ